MNAGEFLLCVVAYASMVVSDEKGPDGHPVVTSQFTQTVLPMVEMPDKEGGTLFERVKTLFDVVRVSGNNL